MDTPLSVVGISPQTLLQIYDILKVSENRGLDRRVARSLETSKQKLQIWQKTWLDSNSDTTKTSTVLWGSQGSTEIQKLLHAISNTAQKIEVAVGERYKIKSQLSFSSNEKNQPTRHDSFGGKHQARWKRAFQKIREKKSPPGFIKHLTVLELATELSGSIDELWTYSEVVFNSLHGVLARRTIDPRGDSVDDLLSNAIRTRAASTALYRACSRTTRDCSLEVDVFGAGAQLRTDGTALSGFPTSLFYHLSARIGDSLSEVRHMTVESVVGPDIPVVENAEIKEYEDPDLTAFGMPSASETGIIIRPKTADTRSYFRVAEQPANVKLETETPNLAQTLYKWKVSSTTILAQTLPFRVRVELAFKVVRCALYLLGTPWLASLNSKRLRRMEIKKGRPSFVLEVQTLDLEEISFADPEALTEPSQLFRIGVLLVEIALSNPEHSAPTEIQEVGLRTSKMLTLVQQSMGAQYCKATAFCLRDRRSASHFGLPEKYAYPEKTGWKPYLLELLEDYHSQVFLR